MGNKRHHLTLIAAACLASAHPTFGQTDASSLQYGLYIHYGMPTFAKPGEQGEIPASRFAPVSVNVKSWAQAAKEGGMTFAVLTVKHESGFCLWPSDGYDYDIAHSPFKGDIIGDFIAACKAEGILPGVHYSIPDAHNEGSARFKGPVPNLYFNLIKKHVTELHTKYPDLRIQIFDVSDRLSPAQWEELCQLIHQMNPQCLIMNLGQTRAGVVSYSCDTIPKGWMASYLRGNVPLNTAGQLFAAYAKAHADNEAFLLNIGPGPLGNIAANQMAVLMQMKQMIANPQSAQTQEPASKPDATTRLKQVKALYDQGLINKDDYDKKVKEIMDSL